jgi:hypothetical protein
MRILTKTRAARAGVLERARSTRDNNAAFTSFVLG